MKEKILEQFPELVQSWGPKILLALLLLAVFWLASRFVRKAIFAAGEKADLEYPVVRLMAMATRVTLLVAGLVTALGTLGVDVSALVAGLGLTGFALGFAIKDTISNILAGVLLLVYRPFSKTDYVEVKGMEGRGRPSICATPRCSMMAKRFCCRIRCSSPTQLRSANPAKVRVQFPSCLG